MKNYVHFVKLCNSIYFFRGSKLSIKILFAIFFCQISQIATAQYPITEQKMEDNRIAMANRARASNFWLTPESDGAIGVVCYAFGTYYTGINTAVADNWILQIDKPGVANMAWDNIYFQMPVLLRFLLDDRFNANMSQAAKDHLLALFYNHLNTHDYLDPDVWDIEESENHNVVRKSVDYLASLALSKSTIYQNATFTDGTSVNDHLTAGITYWKAYFLSRAQKGLEVEIHSPTYTKYTLQCYYNICDLGDNADLKKTANLYMHLYWADIAQHFIAATNVVGGSMTRTYKSFIYKKYNQYPRSHTTQFGWTYIANSDHPSNFIELVTNYRVPDIISKIATTDKTTDFLVENKSWGVVPDGQNASNNPYHILPGAIGGDGSVLRQSYVTNNYVMGTTLYDIRKEFSNIAAQNRVMGVYFSNSNDRILINGDSKVVNGEAKGYRDITGITGKNCQISWRPSKYDVSNALGTRIFMNTNLYNDGITLNNWWFCMVGNAYVAMRTANQGWSWKLETASGSQGGYFELTDDDSPIIIECAKKTDYVDFAAFQNDILDNTFSFSNNILTYTSSAGEPYKVYRNNNTAYPQINGIDVNLNTQYTYKSQHVQGVTTADPYKIQIKYLDDQLEIDYQNLTETYIVLSVNNPDSYKNDNLIIYPNPNSSGVFKIKEDDYTNTSWEVYSILGVKVLEGTGTTINLSGNAKGLYFCKRENITAKLVYN